MITTLPGLYLASVGVVKPAGWIFGWPEHAVCSIGMLRFINVLFSAGTFYLLYLLLRKLQPRTKVRSWAGHKAAALDQELGPLGCSCLCAGYWVLRLKPRWCGIRNHLHTEPGSAHGAFPCLDRVVQCSGFKKHLLALVFIVSVKKIVSA